MARVFLAWVALRKFCISELLLLPELSCTKYECMSYLIALAHTHMWSKSYMWLLLLKIYKIKKMEILPISALTFIKAF